MEYIAVFAESHTDFKNYLQENINKEDWEKFIFAEFRAKIVGHNFTDCIFTEKMQKYSEFVNLYQDVIYRLNRGEIPKIPGDRREKYPNLYKPLLFAFLISILATFILNILRNI